MGGKNKKKEKKHITIVSECKKNKLPQTVGSLEEYRGMLKTRNNARGVHLVKGAGGGRRERK